MKSITQELRDYADEISERAGYGVTMPNPLSAHSGAPIGPTKETEDLYAIADRIDEMHESACAGAYGNGVESVALPDLTGYVKLPVDADGMPINIGDVMAYADNTKPMEVVALVPPAVFLTEDGSRYADMCRHYHRPTVEDVLREFVEKIIDSQIPSLHPTYEEAIAEYAERLRKEDGE